MDRHPTTRRSASHGALSSSYSAQDRASFDNNAPLLPPFRPLKSVKESTAFLASPGPLESMLKTTTETGDIGIFSIGPFKTSSTVHNIPRSRPSLGDMRRPRRSNSRSSDRPSARDDRRLLPSYRDSTSEILSMYGSENQSSRSISTALSPAYDDNAPRSYSMTSYGSKRFNMSRVNGTLQFQPLDATTTRGQRPRSPFPYPTRLKRPGVRPASPALTDTGAVDYSKMVEIDRVSHRTVHTSYKSLFPYQTTRQHVPPMSLPTDQNHYTRSLSNDHGTDQPYRASTSRPTLPNNPHPRGDRFREQLDGGSSEQSVRSMSLTSAVDGAVDGPQHMAKIPEVPNKPAYYDYSEDFEGIEERPVTPEAPLAPVAPVPTRMSVGSYRPMVLQDNCDTRLESSDEGQNEFMAMLRRSVLNEGSDDDDDDESCREDKIYPPMPRSNTKGNGVNLNSQLPLVNSISYAASDTDSRQGGPAGASDVLEGSKLMPQQDTNTEDVVEEVDQTLKPSPAVLAPWSPTQEVQSSALSPTATTEQALVELADDDQGGPVVDQGSDNGSESEKPSVDCVPENQTGPSKSGNTLGSTPSDGKTTPPTLAGSNRLHESRLFSLGSGLGDLASFVNYVDRHIRSPSLPDVSASPEAPRQAGDEYVPITRVQTAPSPGRNDENKARGGDAAKPSLRRYNKNIAVLKAKTNQPTDLSCETPVRRPTPMLAPSPISPAKLLRVKNSIPQLMKALPPLPGYFPAPESPFTEAVIPASFDPFDLSKLTEARSTLTEAILPPNRNEETDKRYNPFVFDESTPKPKFKVKHAASFAPGHSKELRRGEIDKYDPFSPPQVSDKRSATATEYSTAPIRLVPSKGKLKIKRARPGLETIASDNAGTVRRHAKFEKSNTVSDIASQQPHDLFSRSTAIETAFQHGEEDSGEEFAGEDAILQEASGPEPIPVLKVTPSAKAQYVPVISKRGSSLDTHLNTLRLPSVESDVVNANEMHSFFSETSDTKPPRGLRKRISNLKARIVESRHRETRRSPLREDGMQEDSSNGTVVLATTHSPSTFRNLFSVVNRTHRTGQAPRIAQSGQSKRLKKKLGRWMKGAKHVVRAWSKPKRRAD